jgi:ribosomal protein S18 acetylase RimI-like enzyme
MTTKISLATKERYGVLRSVYVREDLRRQGLAKSLVQYCLRYFDSRGIHRIVSKVHHENEPALALMRRIGFDPLHVTCELRASDKPPRPEPEPETEAGET